MNRLKRYTISGLFFVLILGTLSHFIYEWTGSNFFAGLVTPVSESVWEHMKLVFFPLLVFSLYMNKRLRSEYPCVTAALCAGLLLGTFSIPVIFYTYTGILGFDSLWLDLASFLLSVIISFRTIYKLTLSCRLQDDTAILKLLTAALFIAFLLFTYFPPDLNLFRDPTI